MDAELFSNSRSDRSKGVERSVARTHQEGNDADDDTHHDDQRHDAETHRFRPSNQRIDCTDGREALAEHLTRNNEGDDDGKVFAHAFKEDLHAGHDFNEFTLADVFEDHGDENRDDDSCRDAELDGRQTKVLSHNRVEREQEEEQTEPTGNGGLLEMIFPIALLLIFSFAALLYSGGFWSDGPTKYQFGAAIGASSSSSALCWAGFGTLVATMLLYVPRGVLSFTKCMDGAVNGMKLMLPANIILVLAWTLSGICRDLLMSAQYVEGLVTSFGGDVMQLFPFICFAAACVLSFATGASWATFGILVPILVPIAYAVDPSMVFVVLGAVLAGSVFGDHSSPISDTSVLSAASSGCPVMEHAATQLPYALLTAFAAGAGYLASGFTNGNLWLSWSTAVAVLGGGLWWFLSRQTDSVSSAVTVAKS